MTIINNHRDTARPGMTASPTMMHRGEFFAALLILAYLNGLAFRAFSIVTNQGWQDAILSTFGVSLIVWLAWMAGVRLLLLDRGGPIRKFDFWAGVVGLFLIWLPIAGTSWLAMTAISLYLILTERSGSDARRGAVILLAVSVPMFWSPMVFFAFSNVILGIDAFMVGWLLGTERSGNMISFLNGPDSLVILPGCSSFAHLSLIPLCWIALSVITGRRTTFIDLVWCGTAVAAVVSINVIRLAIMGLNVDYYQLLHSPTGDTAVNLVTTSFVVGICVYGLRRELFSRV